MKQPIPTILKKTEQGTIITVHVQPRATKTECAGIHGEAIKFRVAAPPVEGAANDVLCRFLAKTFSLPQSAVSLEMGSTGRRKRILLKGLSPDTIYRTLHLPNLSTSEPHKPASQEKPSRKTGK